MKKLTFWITLLVIGLGIFGYSIFFNDSTDSKTTSTSNKSTVSTKQGQQGGNMTANSSNQGSMSTDGQTSSGAMTANHFIQGRKTANQSMPGKKENADTMAVRVQVLNEDDESNNSSIRKKPEPETYVEKSAVREEVEVVDSLDPIVIYAEHGKWSEKAYIKKSYSDRDNPVVHFDISYSGPVRVQGHDAYGDGTTIVDLDSPDFNKKIGSDLSNWCLNFTSLTPNTEKITIRRWIKRNV